MDEIGFFFSHGDRVYQLPVNPEKLEVQYPGDNEVKQIVSLGEILILKGRKLAKMKIDSWLPEQPWYAGIRTTGEFLPGTVYDEFFKMIMEAETYMRLVVTGINLNMLVGINDYKHKNQAGDHEDIYFTLDLQEYKPYNVRQVPITNENIAITQRNVLSLGSGSTGSSSTSLGVPTQITIGSAVLVTGKLFGTSYGKDTGGKTLLKYTGRISHINDAGSHPYHVTTPEGGWLGWVTRESVTLI